GCRRKAVPRKTSSLRSPGDIRKSSRANCASSKHLLYRAITKSRLKTSIRIPLKKFWLQTYAAKADDFQTLLAMPGVGAKTLRALSLIAEVTYGTPASWKDPVKFSFAHGGKDGHPYPVNREAYDESIEFLRTTLARAMLEQTETDQALKRLLELFP